jgi:Beta-galactosidase
MDLSRTVASDGTINYFVSHTATASEILDFYQKVTDQLPQIQADAGVTIPPIVPVVPPVIPPVVPPVTSPSTFPTFTGPSSACKGITAYSTTSSQAIRFIKFGDNTNTSDGCTNQSIYGANILLYWSQIETADGVYDWSVLDAAMKPWIDNNKKVILRMMPSGWSGWNPPHSAQGTPSFVLSAIKKYTNNKGGVVPAYWDSTYKTKLQAFITAFGAKYNSNKSIEFIHIAAGMGGECKPDTDGNIAGAQKSLLGIGYSNDLWLQHIKDVASYYQKAFPDQKLACQTAANFWSGGGTKHSEADIVGWMKTAGIGLQNDGIGSSAKFTLPDQRWKGAIFIAAEQRNDTAKTGDSFECDVEAMISFCQDSQPIYCLCFPSDLLASANQSILAKYAATH